MLIFIVGYMGSGKSTVGRKLARKLDYEFLDTDRLIEAQVQKSLADYMEETGEDMFRQLEYLLLESLLKLDNTVVATGGGMPCFFENMKRMNKGGTTIYLKLHPTSLYIRLKFSSVMRPLLRNIPEEDRQKFIEEHLQEREQFYRQAKIIVKGENIDIKHILTRLEHTG